MSDFIQQESNRCLHCKNPQCQRACPIGFDTPAFLQYAACGQLKQAQKVVSHLFGEICGYVCPHENTCKGNCVLNARNIPVDVGRVEREVYGKSFPVLTVEDDAMHGKKIAVVGGGVAGITFAEQCYRHGAQVVIYEKNQLLHTVKSIPSFRLPKEAVARVENAVNSSGIRVEKQAVTQSVLLDLQKEFDVVYLAVGVSVPRTAGIQGENLATVADDFLRTFKTGDVVVVGGGNTAIDCARLAARLGNATVAYRRTRADMPAFTREVQCAEQENVKFCFNLAPVSLHKQDGKIVATFAKTVNEGRGKLIVTDETVQITCDVFVVATGNVLDNEVYCGKTVPTNEYGWVCGNLFAGGDATGKSLVAEAVADAMKSVKYLLTKE